MSSRKLRHWRTDLRAIRRGQRDGGDLMGPFPFLRLAPFARSFDNPFLSPPSYVPFSSSATGYSLTRYYGDTAGTAMYTYTQRWK